MRNPISFVLLIVLILAVFGGESVNAQRSQKLSSTPKAFQVFYAKFRSAVVRRNKTAVATLTRFPFEYGWDAGDEGTYSRAQFTKNFNRIFEGTSDFFNQKNPTFFVEGSSYNLTNGDDASHYIFKKAGASFKFTAISVEP